MNSQNCRYTYCMWLGLLLQLVLCLYRLTTLRFGFLAFADQTERAQLHKLARGVQSVYDETHLAGFKSVCMSALCSSMNKPITRSTALQMQRYLSSEQKCNRIEQNRIQSDQKGIRKDGEKKEGERK